MRIITALILLLSWSASAFTTNAPSSSRTDVANAIAALSHGDTVNIPSGTSTWASAISVNHAITIAGSGSNTTHIIGHTFDMNPGVDKLTRITGIMFDNAPTLWATDGIIQLTGGSKMYRIDHCFFNYGSDCIQYGYPGTGPGPAYGVIDHNTFFDCNRAIFAADQETGEGPSGTAAWARGYSGAYAPGTTNTMCIEDNAFFTDSAINGSPTNNNNQMLYGQYGARATYRYNTMVASGGDSLWIDAHGAVADTGTMLYEIYSNTATMFPAAFGGVIFLRGGSHLVWGNVITTSSSQANAMQLVNEWSGTNYPYFQQGPITNCFFWNNVWNGSPWADLNTNRSTYHWAGPKNVTWWMNAPQTTNAYFPYTPLVYPHPLVSGSTYYIATNGSSANSGTSSNSAWPITLLPGVPSGSQGNPTPCIILPGLYTWSGSSVVLTQAWVSISSTSNTATFTNITGAHPFQAVYPAHDITWDGLSFQNNQYDFQMGDQGNPGAVSNVTVRNFWIKGTGNAWAPAPNCSGIEVVCGGGWVVENCLLEYNGTNDVGSNHGIYGGGTNGICRTNICRFNGGAGIIINGHLDTGGVRDNGNMLVGNLCYSNLSLGAQISIKNDVSGNSGTNSVINNTVQDGVNSYAIFCDTGASVLMTNNIILSTGSGIDALGTVRADYNMAPATLAASGPHDVITNYFGLNADYTLKSDSPAIGKGLGGVDIGAYQFSGTNAVFTNSVSVRQLYILR